MKYSEQEITIAYENGYLFVKCLNDVKDDCGVYHIAGHEYEVIGETDDCWFIECENDDLLEMKIDKNDEDFILLIK